MLEGTDSGLVQPVIEWTSVARLCDETQNDDAVQRFMSTFLTLLPDRVSRILLALRNQDSAVAMDAVLSLKITSAMIGALRMEQLCCYIETALVRGDYAAAEGAGAGIVGHSTVLALALDARRPSRFSSLPV